MHCLPGMVSKIRKINADCRNYHLENHMVTEITAKIAGDYEANF